ncbi:MAG: type VI secretion system tip protein VgrG [Holosporaceae bacterium]|jgi:type VI secretion system secreted protein VgrG|nr:type VI secretion system tip protein VgrG [Holosporaceae bacterium]
MFSLLQNQKKLLVQLKTSFGDDVVLKSLRGSEVISELFEYRVTFLAKDGTVDLEKALGSSLTATIKSDTQERYINGIVTEFAQGVTENKTDIYLTEYTAVVRPKLWLLSLDRNHLIFQKKTAIDIIKQVLKDGGINDLDDKTKSCGKVERDYCVQYGESSFNFVSRLMEDEGIFYFFKHENGKHTLVLADSSSAHQKISGESKAGFVKSVNNIYPLGKIFNTQMVTAVNTGGYSTADYNHTISQTKLFSKLDSQWKGTMFYEYPGNFAKAKEGDDLSKLRVEQFEFNHCLLKASSTVPGLTPGFSFEVKDHHYAKFNQEYVVYVVEHYFDLTGADGYTYGNNFQAFPKGTEFRPVRKTPKPRIYGSQTAVVVCASGEEIMRNEHCAIKVHFHWDQIGKDKDNEESSCWIRVAQLIAGSSWGAIFVPRVGQEVVVSFLEGDPDRPLVVGCVYNDQFLPPYPDGEAMKTCVKTVTFKADEGFNEFRINDEKDKEEIYVHAQKDMYINILNSRKTEIEESHDTLDLFKGCRTITLKAEGDDKANHSLTLTKGDCIVELTEGDHKITLTKGNQEITLKEGNRTLTLEKGKEDITLKEGNRTVTLSKGNLTYKVEGDCTMTFSGNLKIKADGEISLEAGKDVKQKAGTAFSMESGTDFKAKAGTALSAESGTDFKMKAGTALSAEATTDMQLKGLNIKAEATMNMEMKANMKIALQANLALEAKSSLSAKIEGVMVELAGQGMVKIGGPMITVGGGMVQLG